MSRRILIDTDAAADGIVGLVMALRDPSVDIAAVTTVAGKVSVEQATRNALTAIEYAGGAKPPVYRGSSKPLYQDHVPFEKLAGKNGLSDLQVEDPVAVPEKESAVNAMISEADKGALEILALGPLTNLAAAMMKKPSAMRKVSRIFISGGCFNKGNVGHLAAYNLWKDADAADFVLGFGVPITMVTIEAADDEETRLYQGDRERARSSRCGAFCMDSNTLLYQGNARYGEAYVTLPGAAAAAVALAPWLVKESRDSYTRIELSSDLAYGATVNDFRERDRTEYVAQKTVFPPFNCKVVCSLHGESFKSFLFDRIL